MVGTPDETRHLFVAPHLDDVALSCGGRVRRLTAAGERVLIATVVTADPPAGERLTSLARRHHIAWGLGDEPFGERCREDLDAAALLGAESVHLGLLDAIYRRDPAGRPHYTRRVLRVCPDPADVATFGWDLRDALEETLAQVAPDADVYAPLGIGGHIDHVLVRKAIEALVPARRIAYYEDYPYARRAHAVWPPRDEALSAELVELTSGELSARIAAAETYVSQLSYLFPTPISRIQQRLRTRLPGASRLLPPPRLARLRPHAERQFRAFVARVGGERYWRGARAGDRELATAAG